VRYLMASLVVGTLFAYLNYSSYKRRLVFMGVALLVPIVANWLRAYMIVMIGHLSSNRLAVGADHLLYGWVFFGVVIGVMFWIGARWRQPEADAPRSLGWAAGGRPAAAASTFWSVALVAALVAALPHLGLAAVERAERDRGQPRMASLRVPGWQASDETLAAGWKPSFHGAAAEYSNVLRRGADGVGLYIGYYRQQDYERKLVTSTNTLVRSDSRSWVMVSQGVRDVPTAEGSVRVREALLRGAPVLGGSAVPMMRAWQVYWIDGRLTTSDHMAKVLTTLSRLFGRGDDGAVLVFYALEQQPGASEPALQAFVAAALPVLRTQLQQMSDGSVAALAQRQ
jgi:EpsI family protein